MFKISYQKYLAGIISTIPVFLCINIICFIIFSLGLTHYASPLFLGIIAGAIVDLDNRFTGRIKNIFFTILAFSLSSLVVQLISVDFYLFLVAVTSLAFFLTLLGAIGERYRTIAFGSVVVIIYNIITYRPEQAWFINYMLLLGSSVLYSLLSLAVYFIFPNKPLQTSLANSFYALAKYLHIKAKSFDPDEIDNTEDLKISLSKENANLISAFNQSRIALFYRLNAIYMHRRTKKMTNFYFIAQDIHERVSSQHIDYKTLIERFRHTDLIFRISRLIELQAQNCREMAKSLTNNSNFKPSNKSIRSLAMLNKSCEFHMQNSTNHYDMYRLKHIINNLHKINSQFDLLTKIKIDNFNQRTHQISAIDNIRGLKKIFATIKNTCNFNSQLFRHAIRLSLIFLFCLSVNHMFDIEGGYWALLTAVFVCQPNYTATKNNLKKRILGTILGVIAGSFIIQFLPSLEIKLGFIVITTSLFFFFRSKNLAFSTFFISIQAVLNFNIAGLSIYSNGSIRIIDTIVGATIAWFAVAYLWPDWKYLDIDKTAKRCIKANAKYMTHILAQLQFGRNDSLEYRKVRRSAHDAASYLSATITNMNSEPKKYKESISCALKMLKINDSLLSYISALAADRDIDIHSNLMFFTDFIPQAKKIIYLMNNFDHINSEVFTQTSKEIRIKLELTNNNIINDISNIEQQEYIFSVISQLLLILNLIERFFENYQLLNNKLLPPKN